VGLS
jgi:hypothetical protein